MKILIIDNYDSFTYNLVEMVEDIVKEEVTVVKNDKVNEVDFSSYDGMILSPGPGIPSEAGDLLNIIKTYSSNIPTLGVCLGHQAIGEVFGGKLLQLEEVYHGIGAEISVNANNDLYSNITNPIEVGRYHSWVVDEEGLPVDLEITSRDNSGIIMSFKHKKFPITGVQFHPESILTPQGKQMISNWINTIK